MPKMDVEIGLKFFNTKGGYLEEKSDNGQIERQHVTCRAVSSDDLIRFIGQKKTWPPKKYQTSLLLLTTMAGCTSSPAAKIKTDIDCTFVIDKPHPASILKIYTKAKILPNYKES